jgi:hypothetical protein
MEPDEFDDEIDLEDEDWEEETFELGWDESEIQSVTREIVSAR